MAGITTWNGATAPAGSEAWNYASQIKRALETSGLIIPVADATQRNGLAAIAPGGVLPVPTMVYRLDTDAYETWDGAVWRGKQHAEFTTALNTAGTNTTWGMGIFSADPANTTDSGFVTINARDYLKVRDAGLYAVTVLVSFTTPISGVSWLSVDGQYTTTMGGGLQNFVATYPAWNLAANTLLNPVLAQGSGSNKDFTSRVRVTKVG